MNDIRKERNINISKIDLDIEVIDLDLAMLTVRAALDRFELDWRAEMKEDPEDNDNTRGLRQGFQRLEALAVVTRPIAHRSRDRGGTTEPVAGSLPSEPVEGPETAPSYLRKLQNAKVLAIAWNAPFRDAAALSANYARVFAPEVKLPSLPPRVMICSPANRAS
jgi:hypothetical protein